MVSLNTEIGGFSLALIILLGLLAVLFVVVYKIIILYYQPIIPSRTNRPVGGQSGFGTSYPPNQSILTYPLPGT